IKQGKAPAALRCLIPTGDSKYNIVKRGKKREVPPLIIIIIVFGDILSCHKIPFYRRYLKKSLHFTPYYLMGEYRNEIQLWNEPCELQQLCVD
ncbi:unnamed protein product, partial [Didymodactylos carnosus]